MLEYIPPRPKHTYNYMVYPDVALFIQPKKNLSVELMDILSTVCNYMSEDIHEVRRTKRNREYVACRHLYFYFSRRITAKSFHEIGALIEKNHATVLHGCKAIENLIFSDRDTKTWVQELNQVFLNKAEQGTNFTNLKKPNNDRNNV